MQLPDFQDVFMTREGSIGEYVYDDCPVCEVSGECDHITIVCRNCGAPPVSMGCFCDTEWDQDHLENNLSPEGN